MSQAYVHVKPTAFETEEDLAAFKVKLTEFTRSRIDFFLSSELPIEIEFEEGSLIARVTVLGTIGLLFQGIANYKNFREGVQLIYSDSKRVTEYIISETIFESGSKQQDVIRLEARVGIIGSIQKVINQLDAINRGASGASLASDVAEKIRISLKELEKLMDNINEPADKELVRIGLQIIATEIPETPTPPKDKVNLLVSVRLFQRKRRELIAFFEVSTANRVTGGV